METKELIKTITKINELICKHCNADFNGSKHKWACCCCPLHEFREIFQQWVKTGEGVSYIRLKVEHKINSKMAKKANEILGWEDRHNKKVLETIDGWHRQIERWIAKNQQSKKLMEIK